MLTSPKIKLYHTGVIVDSLELAMKQWGDALGVHWAPPLTTTTPLRSPKGIEQREAIFTYSLEGPHHIELLEQVVDAPYLNLSGDRHIHHLGYYTTDLIGESERLEALGMKVELSGVGDDGGLNRATFHYLEQAPGFWIELVDDSVREFTEPWLQKACKDQGVEYVSPFTMD